MSKLETYLERKAAALAARQDDWRGQPEKSTMTVRAVSEVAGVTGARPVTIGKFHLVTDSAPGLAGHALGPTSPELLLGALASCLVHTYLIQAALTGTPLDEVAVSVSGTLDYGPVVGLPTDAPSQFSGITYSAHVTSPAGDAAVAGLHAAVELTCPVLNSLRYPVTVTREG